MGAKKEGIIKRIKGIEKELKSVVGDKRISAKRREMLRFTLRRIECASNGNFSGCNGAKDTEEQPRGFRGIVARVVSKVRGIPVERARNRSDIAIGYLEHPEVEPLVNPVKHGKKTIYEIPDYAVLESVLTRLERKKMYQHGREPINILYCTWHARNAFLSADELRDDVNGVNLRIDVEDLHDVEKTDNGTEFVDRVAKEWREFVVIGLGYTYFHEEYSYFLADLFRISAMNSIQSPILVAESLLCPDGREMVMSYFDEYISSLSDGGATPRSRKRSMETLLEAYSFVKAGNNGGKI